MLQLLNIKKMKKSILSLVTISLLSSSLFAGDVRVGGFINVVAGINDMDNSQKDIISGYDDKINFQAHSLAGIQFNADVANNMGAVVQLIAQKSDANDDIRMEWGYVSYDVNDEILILAGRVRPSLFLYSNYLDVGYAYTWITPPSEVYYQAQITNLDGLNISYDLELEDSTISLNIYGGNSSGEKINPADNTHLDFSYDNIYGTELSYTNDYMKIRAGYINALATQNPVPPYPAEIVFDDSKAQFYGLGISVDYEDILFASEYTIRDMDETVAPDVTSYYAMLGYKMGDFTTSYTYSVADSDMEFSTVADLSVAGMVNGARASQLDDRTTNTLNVRYDLNSAAALKVEYSMCTKTNSSFNGTTTLTEKDEDINTLSVALNVVF